MEKINTDFDVRSLALQSFLNDSAKEVLQTLPFSYGTFEKATYILRPNWRRDDLVDYQFITTVHNTEDAVEIMKRKFVDKYGYENKIKHYRVFKKVGNVESVVYQTEIYQNT